MRLLLSYALFDLGVSAARGPRHLALESGRGGGVRGCWCGRAVGVGNLGYLDRPHLVQGLFGGRVPLRYGQLIGSPRLSVRLIEIAVVEWHEDHTLLYAADAGSSLELTTRRLDAYHVALPHTEALSVRGREFDPDLRCSILELRGAGGLGAGVEVVDSAPGGVGEGVFLPRLLVRRLILSGEQERPPGGRESPVLHLCALRACQEVATVGLAVDSLCVEVAVGVEALYAVGMLVVTGPLDAAPVPELVVGEASVVAGATSRAFLPGLEGGLGFVPLYERLPVFVSEIHAPCVVQEDVEVALGFAGRLDGLLREVHRAICVRESAGLLAPGSRREDHVGVLGGLGEEDVLHYDEEVLVLEDRAYAGKLGQGDSGVGGADPEEGDRALLCVAPDLHGVGGRGPVRYLHPLDVPQLGELLYVLHVVPVPEGRQVAVGSALAGVLGGGLAVHLQNATAGFAEHTAQEVEVVDLAGGGRGLHRLVEALQDCAQEPFALTDDARRLPDLLRRHTADLRYLLGRVLLDRGPQLFEAQGVGSDVLLVVPSVSDDLVQEPVHEGHVGAVLESQMHVGPLRGRRWSRIYHDELRRVRPLEPIEHPHPEHRLGLGDVVAVETDGVGVVHISVGSRLSVGAEGLLERLGRGRRAQASVAVHVRCAEARLADHTQGVILLQEELPSGVVAKGERPLLLQQPLRVFDDATHRLVPTRLDELATFAYERCLQSVFGVVGLPTKEVLRVNSALVDSVDNSSAYTDDASAPYGDVEGVAVGVQYGGRLHPAVHIVLRDAFFQDLVHPHGPFFAWSERCTLTPEVSYAVGHVPSPRFPISPAGRQLHY